jgi:hypothetical protein
MIETKLTYPVKRNPLAVSRRLTIDTQFLELEGPLANTRFNKDDIEGFRYGTRYLHYLFIPLTRTFHIEVKSCQGKIMTIRMHSFFGIGDKKLEKLFIQIHKQIQDAYFTEMAVHYVRLLNSGLNYELAGALFTNDGVYIKKDKPLIPWIRIGLMSYHRSCSIYDLSDPDLFRSFDYWHDWNASLLRAVVDYKLQSTTYELLK